jgi:alkylated DNA nucleotide flippase Atl1
VESVLRVVEAIPPGRVMSYGSVAAVVGRGGPRQVGRVMAGYGGAVPWWRVVRADGTLPGCHRISGREHYLAEGTPLVGPIGDDLRIDMPRAAWTPSQRESASAPPPGQRRATPGERANVPDMSRAQQQRRVPPGSGAG